jgi:type I restriction enzyme, S subunit
VSNVLPQGWEENKLSEVIITQKGFAFKSKDYQEKGRQIVKVSNFTDNSIDTSECICIDELLVNEYDKYLLKTNDILIATVGSWPGSPSVVAKVVKVPVSANNTLLNQNAVNLKSLGNIDKKYLYYLLKDYPFRKYIEGSARGSANQASITLDAIKKYNFITPKNINEQKRISDILSAFDDKIELNNQMNQTLEDMATTLFKEWFENFNFPNEQGKPYKDNDGEMKSSVLGEIPIDWEVMKISEISENISRRFKLKEHKEVVFVNTGDVLNGEFLHKDYKNPDNLPGQAKKAIKKGDILYSEIRPKNRRFARVDIDVDDYVVSTKFMVIKRNEKIGYNCLYIYLTLDSTIEQFNTIAESRSGTSPQITFDSVSNVKMTLPNNGIIMEKFEKTVEPIFEQIKLNKEQNQTLKQQRDTLLPKLMSGEIRV